MSLALGVDIGGTKILACLVDEEGRVRRDWHVATDATRGGPAVMAAVEALVGQAASELTADEAAALVGIGVCSAGQIDVDRGVVVYASPNLPGWTGMPLRDRLSALSGLPVVADNDANAAAYGEWWAGAGRGARGLVVLTVGTGIGSGIVIEGRVWRGIHWRGGEVGHMIAVADGLRCNCGQRGCLEAYVSGPAIARQAAAARPGWSPTTREVFAADAAGDALAAAVLDGTARHLAIALVSLSSLLDPDRFLLGGGVLDQPTFLPRVRAALADPTVVGQRAFVPDRLAAAALGNRAGAVGAAGQFFAARR